MPQMIVNTKSKSQNGGNSSGLKLKPKTLFDDQKKSDLFDFEEEISDQNQKAEKDEDGEHSDQELYSNIIGTLNPSSPEEQKEDPDRKDDEEIKTNSFNLPAEELEHKMPNFLEEKAVVNPETD
jgi:hypothetical protein